MIAYILHVFGVLVCIGGYLIVNIIGIAEYNNPCSYYPNCFNETVKPISYIMFWLGVICLIMLLLFIVLMPCWIMDCYNQRRKYMEEKDSSQSSQHQINQTGIAGPLTHSSLYVHNELREFTENLSKNNQKRNFKF